MVWVVTFFLILTAVSGWIFLKRDPQRYIHEKTSPMNIFFRWGHFWHHIFKIAIIALFMLAIFSLYKYFLLVSNIFAGTAAVIAGMVLSGGKELLDKAITLDDVISSTIGIIIGFLIIYLFLWA